MESNASMILVVMATAWSGVSAFVAIMVGDMTIPATCGSGPTYPREIPLPFGCVSVTLTLPSQRRVTLDTHAMAPHGPA